MSNINDDGKGGPQAGADLGDGRSAAIIAEAIGDSVYYHVSNPTTAFSRIDFPSGAKRMSVLYTRGITTAPAAAAVGEILKLSLNESSTTASALVLASTAEAPGGNPVAEVPYRGVPIGFSYAKSFPGRGSRLLTCDFYTSVSHTTANPADLFFEFTV